MNALQDDLEGCAQPRMQDCISVIVPVYNEDKVLAEFYHRLKDVLAGLEIGHEILFVDDGSTDTTPAIIERLRASDSHIALIELSRNFGKELAMTAGLDHARGDAAVIIDADLQDPPELIPRLLEKWQEGYDVVYATRQGRRGESLLKRLTAFLFYRVMRRAGTLRMPIDTGDYRVLSRRAVDALCRLREQRRFMKGLFAWIGYRQTGVPYDREPRYSGASKWGYWRLWNFALEGITSFTTAPLHFATYLGFVTALFAFLYGIYVVIKTLLFGDPVVGYPSLMTVILFFGGIQLMGLGIIGEYLGRLFDESKQRPLYLVSDYKPAQAAGDERSSSIVGSRRAAGQGGARS